MKRFLSFLAAAGALVLATAVLRAQPAASQPPAADPDASPPRLTLEELEREVAEYGRRVDATSAIIGGGPWRAPDPAFATPAAWRDAVLRAPRLTPAQLLARAERPRLRLRWSEGMRELYEKKSYEAALDIIRALEAQGRRTDHTGAVALNVGLRTAEVVTVSSRGGRETGTRTSPRLMIEARLEVPVRVLRGDRPHSALAVLAHANVVRFVSPALTREATALAIREAVAQVYARAAAGSLQPTGGPDAWAAWLADSAQLPARQSSFRDSHVVHEAQLGSALANIAGFRALSARYANLHLARGASFRLSDADLQQSWTRRLNASGFEVRSPGGPELRHEVVLSAQRDPVTQLDGVDWVSQAVIHDDDCLAVVQGEFVRVAGDTHFEDASFGFENSEGATGGLRRGVQQTIDSLVRRLGPGGAREGQARHAHADAVAAYLRQRQIVPVPDAAMAEISHRIALAFAAAPGIPESARREFLVEHQGRKFYDLARIGTMRQGTRTPRPVKDAINRVIAELTLADPLGLFAFDNIWNHTYGVRLPELPESFARRLNGPRPSGAGALAAERIVPAIELAYQRANTLSSQRASAVRAQLAPFDAELRAVRLLACDYLPSGGQMNYVETRQFLYRTVPKGWAELRARLPPELGFDRIGPALSAGPDTLTAADQKIAERKQSGG